MNTATKVHFPRWTLVIYGTLAIVLIPWIFNLAQNLPEKHLARHWNAVWVGFDVIMLFTIALTLWFMVKRVVWIVASASALATIFIIDAWFDILTAKPGQEQRQAIFFGVIEIIFAALTFRLVHLVLHHSTEDKNFKVAIKKK